MLENKRFTRNRRLLKKTHFSAVRASGVKVHSKIFVIRYLQADTPDIPARLGIITSKYSLPLAVDRNRVRRISREWFRQRSLAPGDYLVSATKGTSGASNQELRQCLNRLLEKLSKRCKS